MLALLTLASLSLGYCTGDGVCCSRGCRDACGRAKHLWILNSKRLWYYVAGTAVQLPCITWLALPWQVVLVIAKIVLVIMLDVEVSVVDVVVIVVELVMKLVEV